MNNFLKFLFILSIFMFYSCTNKRINTKEDCEVINVIIGHEEKDFNLLYVNPNLHNMLDSIIENVDKCNELKNKDLVYLVSVRNSNNKDTTLEISLHNSLDIYCAFIDGLFVYKNKTFIYKGIFLDNYFEITKESLSFKCKISNQLMYDINDDYFGFYNYVIENNKLKNVGYSICDEYWSNDLPNE